MGSRSKIAVSLTVSRGRRQRASCFCSIVGTFVIDHEVAFLQLVGELLRAEPIRLLM